MKALSFVLLVALLLALPSIGYAQDPTVEATFQPTVEATVQPTAEPVIPPPFPIEIPQTLPNTAAKGLDLAALAIGALAGLLSKYLTNGIKAIPFLTDKDKSKISGPAAILLAGVVSIVTGYLLSLGAVAVNFLDTSGVWQVLAWAWPIAYKFYMDEKKAVIT